MSPRRLLYRSNQSQRIRKAVQVHASGPEAVSTIRHDRDSSVLPNDVPESRIAAANSKQAHHKAHAYSSSDSFARTSPARSSASPWHGRPFPIYQEGDIMTFPPELLQMILQYPSDEVPGAEPNFGGGANLIRTRRDNPKAWLSVPEKLPLRVGHFSYGRKEKIIIAQAADSRWEGGRPVIIVTSPTSGKWMIWRGQEKLDDIPSTDIRVVCTVKYADAINGPKPEDLPSSSPEELAIGHLKGADFDSIDTGKDQTAALRSGSSLQSLLRSRTRVQRTGSSARPTANTLRDFLANQGSPARFLQPQHQTTPKRRRDSVEDAEDHAGRKEDQGIYSDGLLELQTSDSVNSVIRQFDAGTNKKRNRTPSDCQRMYDGLPSEGVTSADLRQGHGAQSLGQPRSTSEHTQHSQMPHTPSKPPRSVQRANVKPKDEVIIIEDEPEPQPEFDLDKVQVHFVTSKNEILPRRWDFRFCGTIDRIFKRADGANIINSEINKLTITVAGEKLNIMRDLDEDFEELVECIKRRKAGFIEVTRGSRDTI